MNDFYDIKASRRLFVNGFNMDCYQKHNTLEIDIKYELQAQIKDEQRPEYTLYAIYTHPPFPSR